MIINGKTLLELAPIKDMLDHKVQASPTSYGLVKLAMIFVCAKRSLLGMIIVFR